MADTPAQAPGGPTEDKPIWVKDPSTGQVGPVWNPEDIAAARANKFVDASQEEANQAHQQRQLEGWKGKLAAGLTGVAETVPFARNIARAVAPEFGSDVDRSVEAHPWIHGATELAAIASGAGATGALEGAGAAVESALVKGAAESAAEQGVAKAVPTLAQRVLGRLPAAAKNATVGTGYGALELTNEKDLPHTPEELASHVLGTLFWGAAGGVAGGELTHGLLKAASPVVQATSKAIGKAGDKLEKLAAP